MRQKSEAWQTAPHVPAIRSAISVVFIVVFIVIPPLHYLYAHNPANTLTQYFNQFFLEQRKTGTAEKAPPGKRCGIIYNKYLIR